MRVIGTEESIAFVVVRVNFVVRIMIDAMVVHDVT